MKSVLGEKGQVTIPKALRQSLGILPGQEVEGKILQQYCKQGGKRKYLVADFLIASHA